MNRVWLLHAFVRNKLPNRLYFYVSATNVGRVVKNFGVGFAGYNGNI